MDCKKDDKLLHEWIDNRLTGPEAERVRAHVAGCPRCVDTVEAYRASGDLLRAWAAGGARERSPQLDAMWTRVRAGIAEKQEAKRTTRRWRHWLWLPAAAALAVFTLMVYPSVVGRGPISPGDFRVEVETLDSETSTVALLDRGADFPQVIWISDDDDNQG
jgi:anti-sigma factor RsiW